MGVHTSFTVVVLGTAYNMHWIISEQMLGPFGTRCTAQGAPQSLRHAHVRRRHHLLEW